MQITSSGIDQVIKKLKQKSKATNASDSTNVAKTLENLVLENWSQSDLSDLTFDTRINGDKVEVTVSGEQVLFYEFGAGITYSNVRHPKSSELGMGAGTYNPQSDKWRRPNGWWYYAKDGDKNIRKYSKDGVPVAHTRGNPAYMPSYKAAQKMRALLRAEGVKVK